MTSYYCNVIKISVFKNYSTEEKNVLHNRKGNSGHATMFFH